MNISKNMREIKSACLLILSWKYAYSVRKNRDWMSEHKLEWALNYLIIERNQAKTTSYVVKAGRNHTIGLETFTCYNSGVSFKKKS